MSETQAKLHVPLGEAGPASVEDTADRYWAVQMEVYAFDTKADADRYHDALLNAFMAMPESEGLGSTSAVVEKTDAALFEPLPIKDRS